MTLSLVIVPATLGVPAMEVFDGLKVVVLDDMVMSGKAGDYFRRLFVQAALMPATRLEYERRRSEYLERALREFEFVGDVLFVGTRAADVDLLRFEGVYTLNVSDRGLRTMSRHVYGDPVMLSLEYAGTLAALDEAVDDVYSVVEWAEVPLLIMRKFQSRQAVDVNIHVARQRQLLAEVLQDQHDAQLWLEDTVYRSGTERRTMFSADYDYLAFIRPAWRDAVVRSLGKAPSVVDVFRLPWCVVEKDALNNMCYRPDLSGRPTASARGASLIEFVQTRLAGRLSVREMVGTWVGGLLCDDLTAVDTITTLGHRSLASTSRRSWQDNVRIGQSVQVPLDYMWMYEAVVSAVVKPWDGERRLDGSIVLPTGVGTTAWAHTLVFAELYAPCEQDVLMATCVVQFLSRLHSVYLDEAFLGRLLAHARVVVHEGVTVTNFDVSMTPLLPGYNYLAAFVPSMRLAAVQALQCCPTLAAVITYAGDWVSPDGGISVEDVCADIARVMLYSGRSLTDLPHVGARTVDVVRPYSGRPGFCYDCMFRPKFRRKVRRLLGPYPTLRQVMDVSLAPYYLPGMLDRVFVTHGRVVQPANRMVRVLHFSTEPSEQTLRVYLQTSGHWRQGVTVSAIRVGQAGVCYSSSWYVAAIIAWTVVGCVVFAFLGMVLFGWVSGGRRSGIGAAPARRWHGM